MTYLRKVTEYLFYLFIFLLPWQTKLILRPAPTNFTEISLYAADYLLLIILLLYFIGRFFDRKEKLSIAPAWYFLIGWEFFILISVWLAPDAFLASYHYLVFLIGLGLFFLLWSGTGKLNYENNLFDKGKIIVSFLLAAFIQAVLGIAQFLQQKTFEFKYLGLAAHDPSVLGTSVVDAASGRWLRAYGGLDHPNILGGVLAIALILAAYQLARKKILRTGRELANSIFLFIFYFISLFALFFTFSRAAWLAFIVGLALLLVYFIRKHDKWLIGRFIALIFFSAVLAVVVIVPYYSLLTARLSDSTPLEQKSISERETYLGQAVALIKIQPLLGVGVGNYTTVLAERTTDKTLTVWDFQPVHDVFLLIWAECGIFALLFFLGFLYWVIKKDRREPFAPAILGALLVLMLFDHWLFSLPFGLLFLFLVLGLI